jgi:hypothetical protein
MSPKLSLHERWDEKVLRQALIPAVDWKPFPTWAQRSDWKALPGYVRKAMVEQAEEALASAWPLVPASVYLQFSQNGNRTNYEDLHFGRRKILCNLMLGECVEGNGRFLPAVMDAAWSICEESSWCLPAHIGVQQAGVGLPDTTEPIVDLFAAETGALLAWLAYLVGPQLAQFSPLVLERIRREVKDRILTPAYLRDDYKWMGFQSRPVNNWNPWINSNWLACVLLMEQDEGQRIEAVSKILRSLDMFLVDYPEDGGCDEGPNYWGRAGASMFDCLELLFSASGGSLTAYSDPLVQNIGQYIYRAQIGGDYYLNFADASAVIRPEAVLIYQYGKRIGDDLMASFGVWLAQRAGYLQDGAQPQKDGRGSSPTRELPGLFGLAEMEGVNAAAPLLQEVWLPGIEVLAVRDREGSEEGLYLAVKGGHNAESHNHNDIGHFVVYRDGKPLIIDAGVETYTRKTFSPQRYEIWTMQSSYHSLPTIDGIQQAPGREFQAKGVRKESSEGQSGLTLDIAGAYPPEAGVETWIRQISLKQGDSVWLTDRYQLTKPAHILTLSLMTASSINLSNDGIVHLGKRDLPDGRTASAGEIRYEADRFRVSVEEVPITDLRMQPVWGQFIYRLVFSDLKPGRSGRWELEIA